LVDAKINIFPRNGGAGAIAQLSQMQRQRGGRLMQVKAGYGEFANLRPPGDAV
jgi:hypothetical protein